MKAIDYKALYEQARWERDMLQEQWDASKKYRWHDLSEDPSDLPTSDGEYWLYQYIYYLTSSDPNSEVCEPQYCVDYFKDGKWLNGYDGGKVLAWREIEPFEEGEEDDKARSD